MSFAPIAIIGRACILPGALTPDALSARLEAGHSLLGLPTRDRWRVSPEIALGEGADQAWSAVGGYVDADDLSPDPDALRIEPARLAGMDPLALWTITVAQDALRDAGHARLDAARAQRTGAIWGNLSFPSEALSRQVERRFLDQLDPALASLIEIPPTAPQDRFMSGLPALLCAEALGLGGAAYCLDAACASSLYAIWLASRELQLGRADMMIAGAVQRADSLFLHVGFSALQALSKQGQSRPFHPDADGLIPAEGAACVVLRRLEDAVRDGERILGVIRGVGLSNDGRGRGFLAPSVDGQQRAIRSAYAQAGLTPGDVDYVECHATGTLLGDRTELDSMAGVWPADQTLRIGSHKSNLGHAITAAGMVGLLKVLGAMERHVIPPTIGLDDAAPVADPARFEVVRAPLAWEPHERLDRPRRAAVSAFGFGGNNAHMIVEEFTGVVPVSPAPRAAAVKIAVTSMGVVAGSCDGRDAFARAALLDQPARSALDAVTLELDGLRTPPADLARAQGMQLATLRAAQEAVAGLELDPLRTGALIGMGCDPQVARHGVRWRLGEWAKVWRAAGYAIDAAWLEAARDAALPALDAAGVIGAMPNIPANRLNHALGICGPSFSISAEELSGVIGLQLAMDALEAGELDRVLVGAAEVTSHDPAHCAALAALMPMDRQAAGDAAIVLVLEREEDARAAGRAILATLTRGEDGVAAPALPDALGHAHAAAGLLRVGAAALAAHHGLSPDAHVLVQSGLSPHTASISVHAHPSHSAPLVAAVQRRAAPLGERGAAQGKLALVFAGAGNAYEGQGRALMAATPWVQASLRMRDPGASSHVSAAEAQVLATAWLSQWHAALALDGLGLEPDMMLGHSLGEVSALFAAGVWRDPDAMALELVDSQLFSRDLTGRHEAARRDWFSSGQREVAMEAGQVWGSWAVRGPAAPAVELARGESMAHVTAIHTPEEWLLGGWPPACEALLARLEAAHPGRYHAARLTYDASIHCPEVAITRPAWRTLHQREVHPAAVEVWSQRHARPHELTSSSKIAAALEAQSETTADLPKLINAAYEAGARTFVVCGPQGVAARWIEEILADRPRRVIALDDPTRHDLATLEAAMHTLQADGRLGALHPALRAALWPAEVAPLLRPVTFAMDAGPGQPPAVAPVAAPPIAAPIAPLAPSPRPAEPTSTIQKIMTTTRLAAAPQLGSALAQRALSAAAPSIAAPAYAPIAAPSVDVSHETHAPLTSGLAALHIAAQQQLGQHQQRLVAAQRAAYMETLAAQQQGVERLLSAMRSGAVSAPATAPAPAPQAVALDDGARMMGPNGELDRAQLEYLSHGVISRVLGAVFAPQDGHAVQTRMPTPPLLLCDRVLCIDAVAGSMGTGTIITESDVTWDSWYLHEGRMSPGIMIESGQADLLLVSYLGIDLQHPGDRAYRLLGCELTYHGAAPKVGETLHYEITIDGWARHGAVILFFFHYDCTVAGELRLSVRGGQAGFFTDAELAESGGVLWTPEEHTPAPDARMDAPPQLTAYKEFDRAALDAFSMGHPERCFGPGFERALAQVRPPRIPHGNRLLLDRVVALDVAGGPWGRGYLLAEADVSPDDWFFDGHFHNDPCMPGTLMFDVCLQGMAFYMAALGMTLDHDGARFEPVPGAQYAMRCRGQVTPRSRLVTYELFVEEVWSGPAPTLWADLLVTVDGLKAFHCKHMGLQLVPGTILEGLRSPPAPDQPFSARPVEGSQAVARSVSPLESRPAPQPEHVGDATYAGIAALALGRHSEAFGPEFGAFDGARRAAHMPGPPYLFMSRVAGVDQPSARFEAGVTAEIGYLLPESAWYFEDNGSRIMPYGVFMEVALQPCGWLSTWIGSMMRSERDLSYRNLDGKATLYRIPEPGEGELITRTKLVKNAMSGGMILQTFEVSVWLGAEQIYTLETVFGFFPPEALAQQVGLPASEEERAFIVSPCAGFATVELGRGAEAPGWHGARLPGGRLMMVDRVTGYWADGGRYGQGKWRGVIDVSPDDWFFRSHFFRDPVQPGSLGVEALFQLLQYAIMQRVELPAGARFESVALGVEHVWRYRGQVTPDHREVLLELDLESMVVEGSGALLATAHAWLWAGGKRIYEVQRLAVRVWGA